MSDRLNRSFFRFCVACRSYKTGLNFVVYENVILDVSVVTVYVVDFVGNEILLLRVAYYRARIDGSGNVIDGDMRISIGISYRGFAAEITYKSADIAARKSAAFVCDSYVCEYFSVSVAYYARARRLTGKTAYACVGTKTLYSHISGYSHVGDLSVFYYGSEYAHVGTVGNDDFVIHAYDKVLNRSAESSEQAVTSVDVSAVKRDDVVFTVQTAVKHFDSAKLRAQLYVVFKFEGVVVILIRRAENETSGASAEIFVVSGGNVIQVLCVVDRIRIIDSVRYFYPVFHGFVEVLDEKNRLRISKSEAVRVTAVYDGVHEISAQRHIFGGNEISAHIGVTYGKSYGYGKLYRSTRRIFTRIGVRRGSRYFRFVLRLTINYRAAVFYRQFLNKVRVDFKVAVAELVIKAAARFVAYVGVFERTLLFVDKNAVFVAYAVIGVSVIVFIGYVGGVTNCYSVAVTVDIIVARHYLVGSSRHVAVLVVNVHGLYYRVVGEFKAFFHDSTVVDYER